jgi:predicted PurR-regulated permease PerM
LLWPLFFSIHQPSQIQTRCITLSAPRRRPLPTPIQSEHSHSEIRGHILFTIAILLALALVWRLREVLILIYVSALFAVVLRPMVNSIMSVHVRGKQPITRPVAMLLLFSAVVIALTLFLIAGLPPVINNLHQFADDLPSRIPPIVAHLKHLPLADKIGVDDLTLRAENALDSTAVYLFASFPDCMQRLLELLTALVLCVYFMLEGDGAYRWLLSLFPAECRKRLDATLQTAELRVSKWLFGQTLLMLILGVCSTIAFGLLHVRYFFLLGVLMGLMNIIPIAGGIITILLVGLVAALDSWTKMAGVFAFYFLYVNVENAYLTPRIMSHSVNLMGLTVLISFLVSTDLAGVTGALVAVPTAALLVVLMDEYMVQKDQP